MFYLHSTPQLLRWLFPSGLVWSMSRHSPDELFLTFDDGPHPEATPFVLDALAAAGMKGSFFCIGKNVAAYPELYERILSEGHQVGNHTMTHVHGRRTADVDYISNIGEAARLIESNWFRPPYGYMTRSQYRLLKQQYQGMQVAMWSVLPGDFDTSVDGDWCFRKIKKHLKPGAIVVFHDSAKALPRLRKVLPATLDHLKRQGWHSGALP